MSSTEAETLRRENSALRAELTKALEESRGLRDRLMAQTLQAAHADGPVNYSTSGTAESEKDITVEALAKALRKSFGEAYFCARVWEAWGYGTMTQAHFEEIDCDCLAAEVMEELKK